MTNVTELKHSQEMFVLLVVEQELSATEAYKRAYPRSHPGAAATSASRLMKNANVQARIAEVKAQQALIVRAATRVTSKSISDQLQIVADKAVQAGQLSAAANALMGIAKIAGLLVDRHLIDATVRRPSARPDSPDIMDEHQWLQEFNPGALVIDLQPEVADESEAVESIDEV